VRAEVALFVFDFPALLFCTVVSVAFAPEALITKGNKSRTAIITENCVGDFGLEAH
jgi:hypothetical protein